MKAEWKLYIYQQTWCNQGCFTNTAIILKKYVHPRRTLYSAKSSWFLKPPPAQPLFGTSPFCLYAYMNGNSDKLDGVGPIDNRPSTA